MRARRSIDVRDIGESAEGCLASRHIRLQLGTVVYEPADRMGKMFFNLPAIFAEFEVDLLRMRPREGVAIAKARYLPVLR